MIIKIKRNLKRLLFLLQIRPRLELPIKVIIKIIKWKKKFLLQLTTKIKKKPMKRLMKKNPIFIFKPTLVEYLKNKERT